MRDLRIAVIREGKIPQDTRTPLAPRYAVELMGMYSHLKIMVESSPIRCYTDEEYLKYGVSVTDQVKDCELFIGVKEAPSHLLVDGKTYMFFSHTIKKQSHNKHLLQEVLKKKIRLIDYELLVDEKGVRIIGFGHFAGLVGAHYALKMWGKRTQLYNIKPAVLCKDLKDTVGQYAGLNFGDARIVITGKGRVGKGAAEIMQLAGITYVSPKEFIDKKHSKAVYTQIDADEIHVNKSGKPFDFQHFFAHPDEYKSNFYRFAQKANVLINCIYWDSRSPRLFEEEDVKKWDFNLRTISDISCDIYGSVPITHRASAISDPIFGYNMQTGEETLPYQCETIDMMTVDNLPNELPRDASKVFSDVMIKTILPKYIQNPNDDVFIRACIAENGKLMPKYSYLQEWVDEN
jgi:saccharopine dehydrogenase (NAD+, L-lysine forming)